MAPERSIQIGMRGSLFSPPDLGQSLDLGYRIVTTDEAVDMGPAFAPGVQTREAGGPTAREALATVRALRGLRLVGCDMVETNPLFDGPGQVTALLAATIAAELLDLIADGVARPASRTEGGLERRSRLPAGEPGKEDAGTASTPKLCFH